MGQGAVYSLVLDCLSQQRVLTCFTCSVSCNLHEHAMKWVILHMGKLRLRGIKCILQDDKASGGDARTGLRAIKKTFLGTACPQRTVSQSSATFAICTYHPNRDLLIILKLIYCFFKKCIYFKVVFICQLNK